ncbi:MAG: AraC family transcriptional regulator ligand-binding domain-containing protein [Geminicoccaceae bacterium]
MTARDRTYFMSAHVIAPLPDLIASGGGKVERPFAVAGVPIELASAPERHLAVTDYLALLGAAAREAGDQQLGISLGECLAIDDLGPFGRLITSSPTLAQAIETTNGLARSFASAAKVWLQIDGDMVRWHYDVEGGGDDFEGRRLDCEQTLTLYRSVVRIALGPDWQPSEVWIERATTQQRRAFETRFGAPARAPSDGYALVFPRHLLDLPMTYARPLAMMERQVELGSLLANSPDDTFGGSVKAIIHGRLSGGYPPISAVARSMRSSVRSLQRRLAEQGIIYSDLVAEVRHDLAMALLAEPSNSQLDVAFSVGYAEAASFSRAFKQWTGMTPRVYRRFLQISKKSDPGMSCQEIAMADC